MATIQALVLLGPAGKIVHTSYSSLLIHSRYYSRKLLIFLCLAPPPSPNRGAGLNLQPELRLDDALLNKNHRSITCCKLVRKGAFAPHLIRTVWQAARLHPFDPSKGLNLSQFQAPKPRQSTTPPPPREEIKPVLTTPIALAIQDKLQNELARMLARHKPL